MVCGTVRRKPCKQISPPKMCLHPHDMFTDLPGASTLLLPSHVMSTALPKPEERSNASSRTIAQQNWHFGQIGRDQMTQNGSQLEFCDPKFGLGWLCLGLRRSLFDDATKPKIVFRPCCFLSHQWLISVVIIPTILTYMCLILLSLDHVSPPCHSTATLA